MRLRRRDFLRAAAIAVALAAAPASTGCKRVKEPSLDEGTGAFRHGVASGDPLADAVVLWTRVTGRGAVDVRWEIARDPGFASVVTGGSVTTDESRDHTVKVDARGLEPGRSYFYRFQALGETSPIGRTKTAPRDAAQSLRFAVVCCSSLPHGYFHVYASIAKRADIDAVVHLGDYIYEYADGDYGDERPSEPKTELETLDDYRRRYAQYRRDPDLQEAHRQHPFITTWDDHEVADNAWKDGAGEHSANEGPYADRKRAAFRAYEEWMPIRSLPDGRIWRAVRYGELADLLMLDTRHWAKEQQTGDGDPKTNDPARQLLGADQESWLFDELRTSKARWKLVCQQVLMSPLPQYTNTDQWDGYPAARDRFYDAIERNGVKDVVVLSGDIHASFANDLARRPLEVGGYDPATGKGSLAVEIVAPAVTSPVPSDPSDASLLVRENAWMKHVDLERHGYVLLDLDEQRAHAGFYYVKDVEDRNGQEAELAIALATATGTSHLVKAAPLPPPGSVTPLAPAPAPAGSSAELHAPTRKSAHREARRTLPKVKPVLRRSTFGRPVAPRGTPS